MCTGKKHKHLIQSEMVLHVKTLLAAYALPYNIVALQSTHIWHGREEERRWLSAKYSKHVRLEA